MVCVVLGRPDVQNAHGTIDRQHSPSSAIAWEESEIQLKCQSVFPRLCCTDCAPCLPHSCWVEVHVIRWLGALSLLIVRRLNNPDPGDVKAGR